MGQCERSPGGHALALPVQRRDHLLDDHVRRRQPAGDARVEYRKDDTTLRAGVVYANGDEARPFQVPERDARAVRAWLAALHARGLAAVSVARKLAAVRSLFRFLVRRGVLDDSRVCFRVLPNDCDVNLHMNNGRYWTIMDLGRADQPLVLDVPAERRPLRPARSDWEYRLRESPPALLCH
mgnify:CR=1 FL=1